MQISMKCSIAVHCLIFIYEAREKARVTSTLLAQSTSCNPVVIRYTLSALKKAGRKGRGTAGKRPWRNYSIWDIQCPGAGGTFLPYRHSFLRGKQMPYSQEYPPGPSGSLSENRRIYKKHHGRDYFGFYDRNLSSGSRGAGGCPKGKSFNLQLKKLPED